LESLNGKVAVVTGAASGIGLALAKAFGAAGCRVVLADVDADALSAAESAWEGPEAFAVPTDVSDLSAVTRLADTAVERFGRVHILCNNAGVSTFNLIEHQTMQDWQWTLGVNLMGVIHGVHTFLPILLRQGEPAHIVNTASIAGLLSGIPFLGPYNVTKVGVVAISETLRAELAMTGAPIGVSVLCPGSTNTRVTEAERNRPPQFGTEHRMPDGEGMRLATRATFTGPTGMTPEAVAAMVVNAILTDRFWVISHGDLRPSLEQRFTEILAATPFETHESP
jgi:NAD(P)-dependent dehydrogenase (short-subunit alcohol dehydrogenase family)